MVPRTRQGKEEEAESLLRHSLAMNQKTLGHEHPQVASSLRNLATLLYTKNVMVKKLSLKLVIEWWSACGSLWDISAKQILIFYVY